MTGPGGAAKGNPLYEFLGVKRYWRYSKTKMLRLLSIGRITYKKGKVPLQKRYLDEMHGKALQDIWTDVALGYQKGNRFPTQKPEALLERIIEVSTNPQQIVYEPFMGSATGGAVCYRLSRRWIGSEISENACRFSLDRLRKIGCDVRFFSKLTPFWEPNFTATPDSECCIQECK